MRDGVVLRARAAQTQEGITGLRLGLVVGVFAAWCFVDGRRMRRDHGLGRARRRSRRACAQQNRERVVAHRG